MDYNQQIWDSVKYIENNLEDKLMLDKLAEKANLSKYHYHRLFHQIVGKPVNKYISQKRMEKAAEELMSTNKPILEIALNYQYGSQEAFSRAFRRVYDMTPGKYRSIYAAGHSNIVMLHIPVRQITGMAA